jgi:hypothetical protein
VLHGEFKASTTEQEMNGVETSLGFLIRAAIYRNTQLFEGAIFRIGKLTRTFDSASSDLT